MASIVCATLSECGEIVMSHGPGRGGDAQKAKEAQAAQKASIGSVKGAVTPKRADILTPQMARRMLSNIDPARSNNRTALTIELSLLKRIKSKIGNVTKAKTAFTVFKHGQVQPNRFSPWPVSTLILTSHRAPHAVDDSNWRNDRAQVQQPRKTGAVCSS